MTPKQAETASNAQDRFSLCVVSISSPDITGIDLSACTKFVNDIGSQLKPLWQNYEHIQTSKTQTVTQVGEITLELSKDVTRFRVSSGAWAAGLDLSEFVDYIRKKSAS